MKFYITKYALTMGIIEVDSEKVRNLKAEEGRLLYFDQTNFLNSYHSGEWYTEKAHAIADAEHRKKKKIASLQKQIAKLEKLTFAIPDTNQQADPDDDQIASKVDFVVALCRTAKGPDGRDFTLSDSQVSLLECCMKRLYKPFFNSRDEQTGKYDQSKIPTMRDIYNLVRAQSGFDAYDLATILKEVLPDLPSQDAENKQK